MSDLRKDPVSGSWVIIAPEQEAAVKVESIDRLVDPEEVCPFCPQNSSMIGHSIFTIHNGSPGPDDWSVKVIPNRLPVLRTEKVLEREGLGMFDRITGVGAHEIFVETPVHDLLMHEFTAHQLTLVFQAWRARLSDLCKDRRLRYISIFRNQGRRAGAKLSHSHSQLIATPMIPIGVRNELSGARDYFEYKERCVFCDLLDQEVEEQDRIVTTNRSFVALCPFASRLPFEVWILPRRHHSQFSSASDEQLEDLASILLQISKSMAEVLLNPDFNLVLKTAPNPSPRRDKWTTLEQDFHWHLELSPRVGRPGGYEFATGMSVNPTLPEDAAEYLRSKIS